MHLETGLTHHTICFMIIIQCVCSECWTLLMYNAVGIMVIFRWMCLILWLPSWCNAVGVVLLIARGWRGTSLPRVIKTSFIYPHWHSKRNFNTLITPCAFMKKICIFAPNNSSRYEQRVGKDAECDHKTGLNQYEKSNS